MGGSAIGSPVLLEGPWSVVSPGWAPELLPHRPGEITGATPAQVPPGRGRQRDPHWAAGIRSAHRTVGRDREGVQPSRQGCAASRPSFLNGVAGGG